jgi:hypothetical protein
MGKMRGAYRVLVGKPEKRRQLEKDPRVDGRIILKWILEKWDIAQDRGRRRA